MIGRRDHLLVQHDGEAVADIVLGDVAELARAHAVEAEDRPSAGRSAGRSPGWRRSAGRPTPCTRRCTTIVRRRLRSCCRCAMRQQFVADRHDAARVGIGGLIHQLEGHLGGLAQDGLELGGVLQARHLHQDAVVALALDGRARACPARRCAGAPLRSTGPSSAAGSGSCRHRSCVRVKTPPPGSVMSYSLRAHRQHRAASWSGLRPCSSVLRLVDAAGSMTRTDTASPLAPRSV